MLVRSRCGSSAHPRLFVYNLPDSYRRRGRNAKTNDMKHFTFPGYSATRLRLDWMYDVGNVFYARALAYRCRVLDPAQADIFWVPAYNTDMVQHPSSVCAELPRGPTNHHSALYQRMRSQAAGALEARGGADHFLLSPRIGAMYFETHPLCELDLLDPRFGTAARLSIEQTPPKSDLPPRGPFAYFSDRAFISVPYPSWVRLPLSSLSLSSRRRSAQAQRAAVDDFIIAPWRHRHSRSVRIAACFGVSSRFGGAIDQLRQRLRSRCLDSPGSCEYLGISTLRNTQRREASVQCRAGACLSSADANASRFAFHTSAAALYWNSTFCLMP